MADWSLDDHTEEGVHVRIIQHGDHYADVTIEIDGQPVQVQEHRIYRDGGTRVYETDRGVLMLPRRLSSKDRTPCWSAR